MGDPRQLDVLRQGVEVWNQWRKENSEISPYLSGVEGNGADLSGADLSGADLRAAKLSGANLSDADLRGAKLSYANLGRADLSDADLRGAELLHAYLSRAYLRAANLSDANLSGANLRSANLSDANLSNVDLSDADLIDADLSAADLSAAKLYGANLRSAHLSRATLRETSFGETVFGDTDLSTVIDLDTCEHVGPSTLDHRTIAKSGRLPLGFLRGCGLPDTLIDYLPSLLNEPIEFYSCFISYSTKDQEFADRLYADLQNKGVRCWFAPYDMQGGKKIHEQIDEAIRVYQRLLLILSPASMDSEWVKREITKACNRQTQEKRRVLFPVGLVNFETLRDWECLDPRTGKDLAGEIIGFYIPDFSNWKDHDGYQREFEKLLKDLKLEK
jgi:uncharacterized protein YjbI with pentapeptide repeats